MKKMRYAVGAAAAAPVIGMMTPGVAAAATTHTAARTLTKATKTVSLSHVTGVDSYATLPTVSCVISPNEGLRAKTDALMGLTYNHYRFTVNGTNWACVGFIQLSTVYPLIASDGVYLRRPAAHYCTRIFRGAALGIEHCNATFRRTFTVVGYGGSVHGGNFSLAITS